MKLYPNEIVKPNPNDLQTLIDINIGERTEKAFRFDYYCGVLRKIQKDPLAYRAFGPYWWAIKQDFVPVEIIDHPVFGSVKREQMRQAKLVVQNSITLTMIAASLYEVNRIENGLAMNKEHELQLIDGSFESILIHDPDLEARAIMKGVF